MPIQSKDDELTSSDTATCRDDSAFGLLELFILVVVFGVGSGVGSALGDGADGLGAPGAGEAWGMAPRRKGQYLPARHLPFL